MCVQESVLATHLFLGTKVLNGLKTGYLKDCLFSYSPGCQLRSTSQAQLSVHLRGGAFSVVAPDLCNAFPLEVLLEPMCFLLSASSSRLLIKGLIV